MHDNNNQTQCSDIFDTNDINNMSLTSYLSEECSSTSVSLSDIPLNSIIDANHQLNCMNNMLEIEYAKESHVNNESIDSKNKDLQINMKQQTFMQEKSLINNKGANLTLADNCLFDIIQGTFQICLPLLIYIHIC